MWGFEGGDQRSRVDGHNGDDDAGQEDGRQLVDIFHAHKHQQGHQEEADRAVNTHVVQQGHPFAFSVLENGRLWSDVHLEETSLVSLYDKKMFGCRYLCLFTAKFKQTFGFCGSSRDN